MVVLLIGEERKNANLKSVQKVSGEKYVIGGVSMTEGEIGYYTGLLCILEDVSSIILETGYTINSMLGRVYEFYIEGLHKRHITNTSQTELFKQYNDFYNKVINTKKMDVQKLKEIKRKGKKKMWQRHHDIISHKFQGNEFVLSTTNPEGITNDRKVFLEFVNTNDDHCEFFVCEYYTNKCNKKMQRNLFRLKFRFKSPQIDIPLDRFINSDYVLK